ncbi:seminase-like [Drosophila santomea]|uniref:seminase-like n=1 Tax=Drosophila santomea TaxID=129105 RepID=UPI0019537F75|nr:seminase-like [Drosophila santomea]
MMRMILVMLLASELSPHLSWGWVYPHNITRRTPKYKRWWKGPGSNTGNNFGGWLYRVSHERLSTICGASYYAPLLLIVSANCIYPYRMELYGASVEPTFTHENIFGLIDNVFIPNQFKPYKLYMDVAVVKLETPIRGENAEFIKLCSTPIKAGMKMTAYAWGFDSMHIQSQTSDTKTAIVPIEDLNTCRKKYAGTDVKVSSTSFCVTHPKDSKKCLYDAGAPLTYKTELCGIVSYGPMCSNTKQPGTYTSINKIAKFIEEIEDDVKMGLALLALGTGHLPLATRFFLFRLMANAQWIT